MGIAKPSVTIDDWAVVPNPATGSYGKLRPGNVLAGKVFGHPRIKEGSFIFTSPVIRVHAAQQVVETKNTAYFLGTASVDYEVWSREHAA